MCLLVYSITFYLHVFKLCVWRQHSAATNHPSTVSLLDFLSPCACLPFPWISFVTFFSHLDFCSAFGTERGSFERCLSLRVAEVTGWSIKQPQELATILEQCGRAWRWSAVWRGKSDSIFCGIELLRCFTRLQCLSFSVIQALGIFFSIHTFWQQQFHWSFLLATINASWTKSFSRQIKSLLLLFLLMLWNSAGCACIAFLKLVCSVI